MCSSFLEEERCFLKVQISILMNLLKWYLFMMVLSGLQWTLAVGYVWSIYLASLDSTTLLSILLLFLWQLVCLICDCLIYDYKCYSILKRFLHFVFAMIYGVWGYSLIWNPYGMLRWQGGVHNFWREMFWPCHLHQGIHKNPKCSFIWSEACLLWLV